MIIIHANFNVNAVKQEDFLKEIHPMIAASRQENGNISYNLQKDTEAENVFTMVEVWQDAKDVASHNSSKHFMDFGAKAKGFLAAPMVIHAFEGEALKI